MKIGFVFDSAIGSVKEKKKKKKLKDVKREIKILQMEKKK